jgi:hypothetical protein
MIGNEGSNDKININENDLTNNPLENLLDQYEANSDETLQIVNYIGKEASFVKIVITDVNKPGSRPAVIDEIIVEGNIYAFRDRLFKWAQKQMFPDPPKINSKSLPGIEPFIAKYCSRYSALLPNVNEDKLRAVRLKLLHEYEIYQKKYGLYPAKRKVEEIKRLRDNFHATLKGKLKEWVQSQSVS